MRGGLGMLLSLSAKPMSSAMSGAHLHTLDWSTAS